MISTSWTGLVLIACAALAVAAATVRFVPTGWRPRAGALAPVLLLALAAVGVQVPRGRGGSDVVVVDVSWSAGAEAPDPGALARAAGLDRGIVTTLLFGERVVALPAAGGNADRAAERAGEGGSELGAALREAGRRVQAGSEVVVFTDGRVEVEPCLGPAAEILSRGAGLRILPRGRTRGGDARLVRLSVPGRVRPGEPVQALVAIEGPAGVTLDVELRVDGRRAGGRTIVLSEGGAAGMRFVAPGLEAGRHVVEARLAPPAGDPARENDARAAGVIAAGARRALLVAAAGAAEPLEASGFETEAVEGPPWPDLPGFDLVVLGNVPATELVGGGRRLSAWVRSGGGLLLLGGDRAFGPGGYAGRPVESVLPLRSDPAGEGLSVAVLMDRSGTMGEPFSPGGATKVAAARSAARRLVEFLPAHASFLFVPFADEVIGQPEVVELGAPDGRSRAAGAIETAGAAHGGTRLVPPIARALEVVRGSRGRTLVLLLTDGRVREESPDRVTEAAAALRDAGAGLFVLAVGEDADMPLLARVAGGPDRLVAVRAAGALEESFLRALLEVEGEERVRLGRFRVVPGPAADAPLSKVPPPVSGFVRTWPAAGADVWFRTEDGAPLLAGGRFGLGRTIAVATDPLGPWAPGWRSLLGDLADRAARPAELTGPRPSVRVQSGGVELTVRVPADAASLPAIVERGGEATEVELLRTGAATWSARLPAGDVGACFLTVLDGERTWRGGFSVPWAPEYGGSGVDRAAVERLRKALGARSAGDEAERDASPWLAGLGLLVFLLDRILKMRGSFRR